MKMSQNEINENTRAYYSDEFGKRILEELFYNSYRTIKNVYLFENFDEYLVQLKSDKNEDKKEQYWNASYYEKLTDYVKISIAFENYNKATLIQKGFLVHKIQKNKKNKELFKRQNNGEPIRIEEFKSINSFIRERNIDKYYLEGLQNGFPTISYSVTLSEKYQRIILLDNELLYRLKEINKLRNQLHFFTDFKGAFKVNSHIAKWKYIKEKSIEIIENKLKTNANKGYT